MLPSGRMNVSTGITLILIVNNKNKWAVYYLNKCAAQQLL